MAREKSNGLSKQERQTLKHEAEDLQKQYRKMMKEAGGYFCEIDMNRHAAQCFFSAGDLNDSAMIFEKTGKFGPAAECYLKLGKIRKAAGLYC